VLEDDEADLEEVRAWAAGLQTLHARIGAGSPALGVPTISGANGTGDPGHQTPELASGVPL
jgi:hypothetical protein